MAERKVHCMWGLHIIGFLLFTFLELAVSQEDCMRWNLASQTSIPKVHYFWRM